MKPNTVTYHIQEVPGKKRRLAAIAGFMVLLFVIVAANFLLINKAAAVTLPQDTDYTNNLPYYTNSTQSTNVFLEIAQSGTGNTLDAPELWVKYYIPEGRMQSGTNNDTSIGIFNGGYGGTTDVLGSSSGSSGVSFGDTNAVQYDFYLGVDSVSPSGYVDEKPCTVTGTYSSALTLYSGVMPVSGWYKDLLASRFYNNSQCNGNRWSATSKTGKYVLFMRVSWNTAQPKSGNTLLGRLNAFKAGGAYLNSAGATDVPSTSYWTDYASASTNPYPNGYSNPAVWPQRPATTIQDRLSADNTNGDYTLRFGADCHLPQGDSETRYMYWKDLDWPEYYKSPYPVQAAPYFDLIAISPSGSSSTIKTVTSSTILADGTSAFNGPNATTNGTQNKMGFVSFTAQGGYKYKWVWHNIARVDGVSFWLPYDDYSVPINYDTAGSNGCGTYNQSIDLYGGVGALSGTSTTDFQAAGGDTLNFLIDEQYTSGTGIAPDTTTNAAILQQTGYTFADAFSSGATGINNSGTQSGQQGIIWDHYKGMSPTDARRWHTFSYKVNDDAKNGAKYCISSNMRPQSSSAPTGVLSSNQICVTINNTLKPYIGAQGSDVHAGDCSVASNVSSGHITGVVPNGSGVGSYGQYIVSGGDAITNFGSGGSAGSTNLTFGKTGKYGVLCRPTIDKLDPTVEPLVNIIDVTDAQIAVSGYTYDLSTLTAGNRYVIRYTGTGVLPVKGLSKASVTIYAPNGGIRIRAGNFGSDTSGLYLKTNLPTVGVTAKIIKISPSTVGVTASLYASTYIDTCSDVADLQSTANVDLCRNTLLLNGFMMGGSLKLKRVGTGTNGLQLSELFKYNPAFYVNPPPGQGVLSGSVRYIGERAPLF